MESTDKKKYEINNPFQPGPQAQYTYLVPVVYMQNWAETA